MSEISVLGFLYRRLYTCTEFKDVVTEYDQGVTGLIQYDSRNKVLS